MGHCLIHALQPIQRSSSLKLFFKILLLPLSRRTMCTALPSSSGKPGKLSISSHSVCLGLRFKSILSIPNIPMHFVWKDASSLSFTTLSSPTTSTTCLACSRLFDMLEKCCRKNMEPSFAEAAFTPSTATQFFTASLRRGSRHKSVELVEISKLPTRSFRSRWGRSQ